MRFRDVKELPLIEIHADEAMIGIEDVKKALKEKNADVIYVVWNNKLYGIVSIGDILRGSQRIKINTQFTYIRNENLLKARGIFKDKANINMIPVVDKYDVLLGDYSRFDLWKCDSKAFNQVNINVLKWYTKSYQNRLFIVKPLKNKMRSFETMLNFFQINNIKNTVCTRDEVILRYMNKTPALFLFVDNDEMCGTKALWGENPKQKQLFYTYESLFKIIGTNDDVNHLKMIVDILKDEGISCYTVSNRENSVFWFESFVQQQFNRIDMLGEFENSQKYAQVFWGDMYSYDYWWAINNVPLQYRLVNGYNRLREIESKFINVRDGERCTMFQPDIYDNTIYFFGSCLFLGGRVSDECTIESYLQKLVNRNNYKYKVVNCGAVTGTKIDIPRIIEQQYKSGDIVILYTYANHWEEIPDMNMLQIAEEVDFPNEWSTDCFLEHCNHKANKLWAERLYQLIMPSMQAEKGKFLINQCNVKERYISERYIKKYFNNIKCFQNKQVGSIVMNCNPFTKGHRYLIEYACDRVDYLIIFVVQEDKSIFTFEERFLMVKKGTSDLHKVIVVPSGEFILSQNLFPEYFIKQIDENIIENTENDICLFADYIAKKLNIKYRFVGEEKEDDVTNEYNNAMKRILPSRGIEVIEIERKRNGDNNISASMVRAYIENREFEKVYELVPETTKKILSLKYE